MPLITSSASVALWTYTVNFLGTDPVTGFTYTIPSYLANSGITTTYDNSPQANLAALNATYASYLALIATGESGDQETLSLAAAEAIREASGSSFDSCKTIITGTNNGSGNVYPITVTYSSPYLIATGHTYDTGKVQIYQMDSFAALANGLVYKNSVSIVYSVLAYCNAVVVPPPITLELKQNTDSTYTPQDPTVLAKYAPIPGVTKIRANFGGTRIGVVEAAINGGFLLYEEVASAPSGTVYVYDNTRAFVISVPAAQLAQYRA